MAKKNLKIIFYNKNFPKIFERTKKRIYKTTSISNVHHIGSTAVPGLGGKGIIDIMIGVKNWTDAKEIVKKLESIGFKHVHPKEKGKIFLSKHRQPTPDNVHIHIVKNESKQYREFLAFRNYLRSNKEEIKRFFKLKLKFLEKAGRDRAKYTKLKGKYVKEILNKRTNKIKK